MIATNHALTGAIIGLVSGEPLVAIPAAFVSHFICDAIPHFGNGDGWVATKGFRRYLMTDATVCVIIVMLMAWQQPAHWVLASFSAFVATSPDLWSIRKFQRLQAGKPYKPGLLRRMSEWPQWFERPIGAVVDAAWAVAGFIILLSII